MPHYNPVTIITKKREGLALSAQEINWLIESYTHDALADYQMSALLMAIFLNGFDASETRALTEAMLYSGEVLDLTEIEGIKVDKHSTGGVGDKISLLLAPIVASCGVPVPMISGRGLAHSGGTLDKLEAIPNFQVNLSVEAYKKQLAEIGVVMIGQTQEIAPADKKLYALRDVTATVECIPLIAGSIMSKKLASGIDALVLDVKCGKGAFMKTEAQAMQLAETLVHIGEDFGKPTVALLTEMNNPLGLTIGNWLETEEAIRCLQGEKVEDILEVTYALAGEMICLGGKAKTPALGETMARESVANGKALEKLCELVEKQGGDVSVIENPNSYKNLAPSFMIEATSDGYIASIDALLLGQTATEMGAGRMRKEDNVDAGAGIRLCKKIGDKVEKGEPLAIGYSRKSDFKPIAIEKIRGAITIQKMPTALQSRILDRYTKNGWERR